MADAKALDASAKLGEFKNKGQKIGETEVSPIMLPLLAVVCWALALAPSGVTLRSSPPCRESRT